MTFERIQESGFAVVRSRRWADRGVLHGFSGKAAGCSEADALRRLLGVDRILRLKQVHGAAVVDLDALGPERAAALAVEEPATEADAFVLNLIQPERFAVILRTADCLPIIVRTETRAALVHAGWRGLAAGVIPAALAALGAGARIEALIGPCACGRCYEVGAEVRQAIGQGACCREGREGRLLLDLAQTAVHQLRAAAEGCCIETAPVCTIEDPAFYSYRRDGAIAERNLTFLVPAAR